VRFRIDGSIRYDSNPVLIAMTSRVSAGAMRSSKAAAQDGHHQNRPTDERARI
jgi:hypothetical protein